MIYSLLPDDIGYDPQSVAMPVLIPHDATGAHYDGGIILGSPEDIVAGLDLGGSGVPALVVSADTDH